MKAPFKEAVFFFILPIVIAGCTKEKLEKSVKARRLEKRILVQEKQMKTLKDEIKDVQFDQGKKLLLKEERLLLHSRLERLKETYRAEAPSLPLGSEAPQAAAASH